MPGHRTQCLRSTDVNINNKTTTLTVTEVPDDVDDTKDEAARAEESQVGAALIAHVLVRSLPAGDEVKYRLGVSKRILRVVKRVVEHLPLIH